MAKLGLLWNPAGTVDFSADTFDQHVVPAGTTEKVVALMRQGGAWMVANEWCGQARTEIVRQAGLREPEDICITGFDNSDTQAGPAIELTAVGVSLSLTGAAALQRLNHRLNHPDEPHGNIIFDVSLVVGKSTGPAAHQTGG